MESTFRDLGPCQKRVEVTISESEIQAAVERSFQEIRQQVALPGFRAGHVPRSVLEKRFGKQVRHEVLHDLLSNGISFGLDHHKLAPVDAPALENQEEGSDHHHIPASGPLTFAFTVDVAPEFDMPQYRGLTATRFEPVVEEADIQKFLQRFAERQASFEPVEDGQYVAGDLIIAEAELSVPGESTAVLGDNNVRFFAEDPEISRGVTLEFDAEDAGVQKLGTPREVTAQIGDDHPEEALRGRTARGTLTITEYKRRRIPTLTDEGAKEMGYDGIEGLRADVQRTLVSARAHAAEERCLEDLWNQILAGTDIPLPSSLAARDFQHRKQVHALDLRIQHNLEEAEANKAVEEMSEEIKAKSERTLRTWFITEKIAAREKIFALDSDFELEYTNLAKRQRRKPSEVRSEYESNGNSEEVRESILRRKVNEFLLESATITKEVKPLEAGAEGASA